ncbi:MAG TPA: hypothetical protein VFA68_20185 [Terriglobales bacterium]|nr:hypothetical protein [Terriglobales bacterium]
MSPRAKKAVERVSPARPEARDEGPRLIPLDEGTEQPQGRSDSTMERYLKLADAALTPKKRAHSSS